MSATRPVPLDSIDELCQVRDELCVVWLALGNLEVAMEADAACVREHVNGLHIRVREIVKRMDGGRNG